MKTIFLLWFSWLFTGLVFSQEISSYLVSNAGDHFENTSGISLHWSLGEPCTKILSNEVLLTQGLLQMYAFTIPAMDWEETLAVKVFPNPFSSSFTIEAETNEVFDFEVMDVLGRSIIRKKGNWQSQTQSLEQLADQAYYLTVTSRSGKKTILLIKSSL
jgi:hypothetical protein